MNDTMQALVLAAATAVTAYTASPMSLPDPTTAATPTITSITVAGNSSTVATSSSCTTPEEDEIIGNIARYVAPIAFAIIGLTGLLGNALVVLVVLFNPLMRSTTNVLILNLAVSDLLFVICCVPFTALDYVVSVWPLGDVWCKTVQYMIVVTANASIYTLVLMSLDRYLAVVHPIESRAWRTVPHTVRACALLWTVIVLASLPAWFSHGTMVRGERKSERERVRDVMRIVEWVVWGWRLWV